MPDDDILLMCARDIVSIAIIGGTGKRSGTDEQNGGQRRFRLGQHDRISCVGVMSSSPMQER
jgi:hypothetical protein